MQRSPWKAGLALAVLVAVGNEPALAQNAKASGFEERVEELSAAAAQNPVPIIARLDLSGVAQPFQPEGELSSQAAAAQQTRIREARERVLRRLGTAGVSNVKSYESLPLLAVTVSQQALVRLANDPEVLDIQEDAIVPPSLDSSIPVMGIHDVWALGYTGSGQTVAILDSGVDNDHPFFGGRVVSEACYSTTNAIFGSTSVCPGGVASSTAPESGENCDLSVYGCDHGTHVAGIAAGNGTTFDGVARDATIIAIQVFSRFDGANCTSFGLPTPCALTYTSDQISGLERVYALRSSFNIAAANMSLGSGNFTTHCDSDSRKLVIDNLLSANIATAIAAGNNGFNGAIGTPACISSAIAVGSTTDADTVSSFSNHATLVDMMAVGSSVNSSVPGGGFAIFDGTSMATPHVAGAWALLKQAGGTTVSNNELCLESTGVNVSRAGITKPRIQVDAAITAFLGGTCGVPPTPPANDNFANAINLSGLTGAAIGTNVNATGETGEPNHVGVSSPLNSVWWDWTPSASGQATLATCDSDYDTTLAVYTGTAVSALTEVLSNDDSCGFQSVVRFNAVAGSTYRIAVDGWSAETGNITLNYGLVLAAPPQMAVGLGGVEGPDGAAGRGFAWITDSEDGFSTVDFVQVPWGDYNATNGETRPAWCDVDGDGRHELVLGLGRDTDGAGPVVGGGGFIEVRDDASAGFAHLAWLQLPWGNYNLDIGETWPACGDLDGDGRDELVVGLGQGGGGFFYVYDDAVANYVAHPATPGGQGWVQQDLPQEFHGKPRLSWGRGLAQGGEGLGNLAHTSRMPSARA